MPGSRRLRKGAGGQDGGAQGLTKYLGLKMPEMWFLRVSSAVLPLRSCSCGTRAVSSAWLRATQAQ